MSFPSTLAVKDVSSNTSGMFQCGKCLSSFTCDLFTDILTLRIFPFSSSAKSASVRALLFDISFLMLCHVVQTYGSEVSSLRFKLVKIENNDVQSHSALCAFYSESASCFSVRPQNVQKGLCITDVTWHWFSACWKEYYRFMRSMSSLYLGWALI